MAQIAALLRREKCYRPRRCPPGARYTTPYRFNEEDVKWVAKHFLTETGERRGGALSYVADPGFQSGISEEMGIHQTTVSKTVSSVSNKIMKKADLWIKFPSSTHDIIVTKNEWLQKCKFPSPVGVIDCTHVRIPKPVQFGDEYINRKGFTSTNVQVICNVKEQFTSVEASWHGSVHVNRIWRNSSVWKVLSECNDTVLLGDEGYGLEPWLMTPFRNPTEDSHKSFNNLLKKERVLIERCFGQLKRRFPVLQYMCRVAIPNVPTIKACHFILHNVAKHLQDEDFEDTAQDLHKDGDNEEEKPLTEADILRRGRQRRQAIAALIQNAGF
ncbi:putative nuclease HARBI1 [Schistocerca piceifrons]|uniref:putative nuclease HARBI1 n=1 Tax=Schistocerca piceifrons TaxID=274613 RepID=UPI001F5F128A|nr:putative nuclease HARBI1 [Schistocerca piceifrons]